MKVMRQISVVSLALLVWLCLNSSLYAADVSGFFDVSLGDFSEELEVAAEEDKKGIMLFFEMDDCPFCHWMKANVLNKKEVQNYYRQYFKLYTVDIEGDVEITDFKGNLTTQKEFAFKQFRVRATPVIAFFDLKGNLLTRFTGRTGSAEEFKLLADYVVSESYKTMNFRKYKKSVR